jgi:hypothetical protein
MIDCCAHHVDDDDDDAAAVVDDTDVSPNNCFRRCSFRLLIKRNAVARSSSFILLFIQTKKNNN